MELKDIKAGDYLYYTELPHSNYADSLIHVREVEGILMAHTICTNFYEEGYINETDKNWGEDMAVSAYYDPTSWHPTTYTEGDPSEWMNKNYPLDDSKYQRQQSTYPESTMNICPCFKTAHDSTACPTPSVEGLGAINCSAEALLASYREHMTAAVTVGEIDEGTALYVGDILQNIIRQNTK
tara:strand:+ start:179 stop:724 length:546 start_codon:yes stop_codon:yes gene_type:complete